MMNQWVQRHTLVAYFGLAFGITWLLIGPLVLSTQNLLDVRLSPHWHLLGALGPVAAAVIVTLATVGRRGLAIYLDDWRTPRGRPFWLLIALFSPFALFALVVLLLRLVGQSWPDWSRLTSAEYANASWIVGGLLAAFGYGFGEEAGWRGFALPRLQQRWNALGATLVLTVFWALWHIPMFFYRFEFGVAQVVGFFLSLFAGGVWLTFLYNVTGGSTLIVALWHAMWNIVNIFGLVVSESAVSGINTVVILVAVLILLVWRPAHLSPRPRHTVEEPPPTTGFSTRPMQIGHQN